MFNLNIPTSLFVIDNGGVCTTPKTPEIVNSLIAMTNPLDNYTFSTTVSNGGGTFSDGGGLTPATKQHVNDSNSHHMISQDSSHSSCSGSPIDSPAGTNTTPSVQQTCSQLIKAGLKLSIQSKRKTSSGDSSSGNEQFSTISIKHARKSLVDDTSEEDTESHKSPITGLTQEDEDRRRRRRERNKIAATKCRMKKRERTMNLVNESEQLETQNIDLKSQVKLLETERRKLFDMLQSHRTACVRPGGYQLATNLCQSPAFKYFSDLGMCEQQPTELQEQSQNNKDIHKQKATIPAVNTIKYSRNNNSSNQNHQHHLTSEGCSNCNKSGNLLPVGYCKPSPTTLELGYLTSPTLPDVKSLHQRHQHQNQPQTTNQQHQQTQKATIIKTDYIPNCENNKSSCRTLHPNQAQQQSVINVAIGTPTIHCNTSEFVLKSELVDAQSPYTTVQSADRFLFEHCESFDIKHSSNKNNNNDNISNNNIINTTINSNTINNSNNNNNNLIDFHSQQSATAISSQSYENLLIKNDFLSHDSDLLAQLTDGSGSEFTDLDGGVSTYSHLTNGGCLA